MNMLLNPAFFIAQIKISLANYTYVEKYQNWQSSEILNVYFLH